MTKEIALNMVGEMARASANHYAVVNGDKRGNPMIAASRELRAAKCLLIALLGSNNGATEQEIEEALGW